MNRLEGLVITALRGLIRIYRYSFSLLLGRQCRFLPTCSEYTEESLRIHGLRRGSALSFKRICKCHPFEKLGGRSGFDPVPPVCD